MTTQRDESNGDRDYPVEVIEGLVESLDQIERLLVEYEENVGEPARLELAYAVDRFDDVVRTLHAARTREVRGA